MSFHEIQFPTDISLNALGGPRFNTQIIKLADAGAEERISRWDSFVHKYDVSYGIKSADDLYTVKEFFIARNGAVYGFRYKDWLDFTSAANGRDPYTATDQTIGTGDGSETQFQLVKKYTSGEITRTRNITKPVSGKVTVAIDDVTQTSDWSVDTTTGIITFTSAPAVDEVITAGFEFDVPARFDEQLDKWLSVKANTTDLASLDSIILEEIIDENAVSDEFYYGGAVHLAISADTTITEATGRTISVTPSASGLNIILPDPAELPCGGPYFYIQNLSADYSFIIEDANEVEVVNVACDLGALVMAMATWGIIIETKTNRVTPVTLIIGKDASNNNKWYAA